MRQTDRNVSAQNNENRNRYVIEQLTRSLIELMKNEDFHNITISQICSKAQVSRASFYRNFNNKEEIISRYLKKNLDEWWIDIIKKPDFNFIEEIFNYYYKHKDICILLYHQKLAYLSLKSILDSCGPKKEQTNVEAYVSAYFSYGLYGFIEEWFKRGMKESSAEMAELFKSNNKE
ncbi:MAG: TetR/AcrR family transcriptional regulator [Erysipelotrichaceae bacterium]